MTIAIHQPNFLPWLGYFNKILNSDIFVILDDVQYTKDSFINRNRIKTPNGFDWITVPVENKEILKKNINEVRISYKQNWVNKILSKLNANYKRSKFYDSIIDDIASIFNKNFEFISELNLEFIYLVLNYLKINKKILFSSQLDINCYNATDRIIRICRELNSNIYLSGKGASAYHIEGEFIKNEIEIKYQNISIKRYDQLWGEFLPNLSIVDLIFNEGLSSINHINNFSDYKG